MRTTLEAHNEALREAIESHAGHVFKHTGDGVCAVFGSPRAAVDAAIVAQRALELPVRMGIATGEAELQGGDYFGPVLNRAARVMAAGHGGQILLDGATAALLSGVDLISLGSRRLRDIARPVDVFQVQADGLPTEFPPLKTVDPTPGNLRIPTTSFIGRRSELAELETALKAHRMLTLTGVGGVGKTRLALEVAARAANDFPDGVWVIELASVGDPAAVPEAVAAVLGIVQQPELDSGRQRRRCIGRSVSAAGVRQLRTRAWTQRPRLSMRSSLHSRNGESSCHQPRRTTGGRRTPLASAVAGSHGWHRFLRRLAIRRARGSRRAGCPAERDQRRRCGC